MNRLFSRWHETIIVHSFNGVAGLVFALVYVTDRVAAMRLVWYFGVVELSLLLIIPRLRKLQILSAVHELLLPVARQSKWVGIWTAFWLWIALLLAVGLHEVASAEQCFLAVIILAILITLVALSNRWSYKHVSLWKQINLLIWMVPPLLLGYISLAPLPMFEQLVITSLLLIATLLGVAAMLIATPDYFAKLRFVYIGIGLVAAAGCILVLHSGFRI